MNDKVAIGPLAREHFAAQTLTPEQRDELQKKVDAGALERELAQNAAEQKLAVINAEIEGKQARIHAINVAGGIVQHLYQPKVDDVIALVTQLHRFLTSK